MEFSPRDIIEQLKADDAFSSSPVYSKLLDYLYKCYEEGVAPHEYDIAVTALGKGKDFDPSIDPTVRVYLSKLRKKLEDYYANKGSHSDIKVVLPRRNYKLEFRQQSNALNSRIKNIYRYILITLPFCIVLVSLLIFLYQNRFVEKTTASDPIHIANSFIWSDFLKDEKPTLLVLGDLFTFREYDPQTDTYRIIRDFYINSESDLTTYKSLFPNKKKKLETTRWKVIPESALKNYSIIHPIFSSTNTEMDFILSSNLEWPDIAKDNIIYIGHFHSLGILKTVFPSAHIRSLAVNCNYGEFKRILAENSQPPIPNPPPRLTPTERIVFTKLCEINVTSDSIDTTYISIFNRRTGEKKDYAVIAKVPGPENNSLLFIISFTRIGREKIVKSLVDLDLTSQLSEQFISDDKPIPRFFEMLVEIYGFDDTPLEMEIKHFFELPDSFRTYEYNRQISDQKY